MFWGGQRNENSPRWGDAPTAETPDRERSVDYMHSTFIDNVLGGLLGSHGRYCNLDALPYIFYEESLMQYNEGV